MNNKTEGYSALLTVLIVAAITLSIIMTLSLTAITEGQMSLSQKKASDALNFVEACGEEALIRLNEDGAIPPEIIINSNTCGISVLSQNGTNWQFTASGSAESYAKSIKIEAERTDKVYLISWTEE